MTFLALFSALFFVMALFAPLYYLFSSKRRMQTVEDLPKKIEDIKDYNSLYSAREKWLKDGKIVHPIYYVNGGISKNQIKFLPKGIHPIRHTTVKI